MVNRQQRRAAPLRAVPAGEHLTADELVYHQQVIGTFKAVQDRFNQVQQQFNEAQTQMVEAQGALKFWDAHLSQKYGITAGSRIEEDGAIVRGVAEE